MDYILSSRLWAIILLTDCIVTRGVYGGSCWLDVDLKYNADPNKFLANSITREECCKMEPAGEKFYSEDELPAGQELWVWKFLQPHKCTMACQDGCSTFSARCGEKEICRVRDNGMPKCICNPYCSKHHLSKKGKVCGNDGRTYSHHCQLLRQNCRRKLTVEVNYMGECKAFSCKKVSCARKGARCVSDQYNRPQCVPRRLSCETAVHSPVCATNNQTYPSMCHLTRYNMNTGLSIKLSYHGLCTSRSTALEGCQNDEECKRCLYERSSGGYVCLQTAEPSCSPDDTSPQVCGEDRVTYENECELRRKNYQKQEHIKVLHVAACDAAVEDILLAGRWLESPNANHINEREIFSETIRRSGKSSAKQRARRQRKAQRLLLLKHKYV